MNKFLLAITATLPALALPASEASGFSPASVYSVTCGSTGQACDRYAIHPGPFARGWLHLTAPESHCSSVSYRVDFLAPSRSGPFPAPSAVLYSTTTPVLAPGQSARIGVSQRARSARISAVGREGGCNRGRLESWGVSVEFEPYVG